MPLSRREINEIMSREKPGMITFAAPTTWVKYPRPPVDQRPRYFIGVDIGRKRNHTAVAVLERTWKQGTPEEFQASAAREYYGEWVHRVTMLERYRLGARYSDAVEWIGDQVGKLWVQGPKTMIVDATGVGSAVLEQIRSMKGLGVTIAGVTITGGDYRGYSYSRGDCNVSRTEIMTGLQSAVERRYFSVAKDCTEADTLRRELQELKAEGKSAGGDDLAFAVALAAWWAMVRVRV